MLSVVRFSSVLLLIIAIASTLIAYELHANYMFSDVIGSIYKFLVSPWAPEQVVVVKNGDFALHNEDFGIMHIIFNFLVLGLMLFRQFKIRNIVGSRRESAWVLSLSVCLIFLNAQLMSWQL